MGDCSYVLAGRNTPDERGNADVEEKRDRQAVGKLDYAGSGMGEVSDGVGLLLVFVDAHASLAPMA
jgi:hypothetical protein